MPAAPISRMKRYCVPGMDRPERYWGLLELIGRPRSLHSGRRPIVGAGRTAGASDALGARRECGSVVRGGAPCENGSRDAARAAAAGAASPPLPPSPAPQPVGPAARSRSAGGAGAFCPARAAVAPDFRRERYCPRNVTVL